MEDDGKTKRKGYMSISQKQSLIDLLTEEHALRFGKFSVNFTKQNAKWNDIAKKLNAIPGGNKTAQEWKRVSKFVEVITLICVNMCKNLNPALLTMYYFMTIYLLGMGRFKNQNQTETFSNKKICQ